MTDLKERIDTLFQNRRDFIQFLNGHAGGEILDETQLSRHLSGNCGISKGWLAAYNLALSLKGKE